MEEINYSEKSKVLAECSHRNGIPHDHCLTCFDRHCRVQDESANSCPMMHCKEGCGAYFHSCKLVEHILLCPNEKVPCTNYENGCPIIMVRHKLGPHLQTCPASVIYCTMEWNRWPLYSKERQAPITAAKYSIHAKYGQLDVALALRDQRILNESMKVSRKTRRVLRNNLTRRFPAVPMKPRNSTYDSTEYHTNETSQTISDDDCDAPWEIAKNPPGLQSSVFGELYKATKKATESLSAALDVVSNSYSSDITQPPSPSRREEQQGSSSESSEEDEEEVTPHDGLCRFQYPDITLVKCALCKTHHHVPFTEIAESAHRAEASEPEGRHGEAFEEDDAENRAIESKIGVEKSGDQSREDGFVLVPVQISKEKAMQSPCKPTPEPVTLSKILNLDLTLEQITRYQQKPKSMYTFLCAQEFRRDEYLWHFKNVHGDIHANLNGWIEQRCPLAQYGCPYSVRRLHPLHEGMTVIHNSTVESFGLKPEISSEAYQKFNENGDGFEKMEIDGAEERDSQGVDEQSRERESTPEVLTSWDYNTAVTINKIPSSQGACSIDIGPARDILTSLPFEILQDIGRCLDSFSLCNMALTCRTLRDVCCSLVEERGIVIQQWEKKRVDGKVTWQVAYKKWCFSTAFSPVSQWGFKRNPHMANHISKCPFYVKSVKTQPILLPSMPVNTELEGRLKESVGNPNLHIAGGEIVELEQAEEPENIIRHKPYSDF